MIASQAEILSKGLVQSCFMVGHWVDRAAKHWRDDVVSIIMGKALSHWAFIGLRGGIEEQQQIASIINTRIGNHTCYLLSLVP